MRDDFKDYLEYIEFKLPSLAEELKLGREAFRHKGDKYLKLARSAYAQLGGNFKFEAFSPYKQLPQGSIPIGYVLNGEEKFALLVLPVEAFSTSTGFFGASGTGKTVAVRWGAIPALVNNAVQVIIWEFDDQYLDLYPKFGEADMVAYLPEQFKMNPILPPGDLSAGEWKYRFTNVLKVPLNMGVGMVNMLLDSLDYVLSNYSTPTIFHLKKRIDSLKFKPTERHFAFHESLQDRMNFFMAAYGKTFDCAQGFSRKDVESKKIILFRMRGQDPIMASLFQDLFNERLKFALGDMFSDKVKVVEVFEEAHAILGGQSQKRWEVEVGERLILQHIRTLRKFGIGFIFVDQAPSLLPHQLLANLGTVLSFRLVNSNCVRRIGDTLGLSPEQRDELSMLPNRRAVIFSHLCSLSPTLVEIHDFQIPKIHPQEIEGKLREVISKMHFAPRDKDDEQKGESEKSITKLHTDILEVFANPKYWFVSLDEKQRAAGNIHPEYFGRIVKELQEMGTLAQLEPYSIGKGKPAKTAFVTEEGAGMLKKDYKDCVPPGKGGVHHRYFQHLLKSVLKNSAIEFMSADVVQYADKDTTVAYEVEMDPNEWEHAIHNVKTDLSFAEKVVVVCRNDRDLKILRRKIEENLEPDLLESVEFKTVSEVLKNG